MDPISLKLQNPKFHEGSTEEAPKAFEDLPPEILANIFSFLKPKDFTQVLLTNRKWYAWGLDTIPRVLDAKIEKSRAYLHKFVNHQDELINKTPHIPILHQLANLPASGFLALDAPNRKATISDKAKYVDQAEECIKKCEAQVRSGESFSKGVLKGIKEIKNWENASLVGKLSIMLHKAGRFFYQSFLAVKSFFIRSCKFVYHFLL